MRSREWMIGYIRVWYGNWERFHVAVTKLGLSNPGGWYISFDGLKPNDMYLCSKDPRGDDEGEVITNEDCFDLESGGK